MNRSRIRLWAVLAPLALLAMTGQGCSSPTTGGGTPGGGVADAAASLSLGFTPSNIAVALGAVDLTTLEDVDLTQALTIESDMDDSLEFEPRLGVVGYTTVTQSNDVKIGVYVAKSWRLEPTAQLHFIGAFPIALVALTTIDIAGNADASPGSYNPAVAGGYSMDTTTLQGGGPGGGAAGTGTGTAAAGSGGGGGGFCGKGGAGAFALGAGGASYDAATLVPLNGGSAGGGGAESGGTGGGAIQLVAGQSVTVSSGGSISAAGGGGSYGGGGASQAAAGGGSGGAILIEAPSVTITGVLAVNGGGGGGSENSGQDGSVNATVAAGGTGGSGGNSGGNGGGGSTVNGASAVNGAATGSTSGAGGGGAGYIRLNTQSGSASITGVVSPSPGACTTQGTIAH